MRLFDLCVAKKLSGGGSGGGDSRFVELVQGTITTVSDADVTLLCGYAFAGRNQLISVDFPEVTDAYAHAFVECVSLKNVNLPKLTVVGNDMFYSCVELERLEFPNVTYIHSGAFGNCPKLMTLILHQRVSLQQKSVIPNQMIVYVENADMEWYSTASAWSDVYSSGRIKSIDELPE